MYDIGIPEIICTERYEDIDGKSIKYIAESSNRPFICTNPDCDHSKSRLHKHSVSHNLLHDTKSEGKLVYIDLKIQRYRCSECGTIITDVFTFYDKHAHSTNRLRDEWISRCIKGETFSYIANDYSVDHKTVAAAFKAYATSHKELLTYNYTPEVLGIDEAHIDNHYRLVLTDIKERRLLDIKIDNKKKTFESYLNTIDPNICKCATMDFAPEYASAVNRILPNTTIVIDKFHVVQELNRCLDIVRKNLQNQYRSEGGSIRRFKESRLLFMTDWENLSASDEKVLSSWFNEFPELYEAYMVKETFRDIYLAADTYEDAAHMFDLWLNAIPDYEQFKPMVKTMFHRKNHILNFWYYQWTNAYTESVNNIIKKIEKAGRGYRFDTLRERCILKINSPKPDKFNPRQAEYKKAEPIDVDTTNKKYRIIEIPKTPRQDYNLDLRCYLIEFLTINKEERNKAFILKMNAYYERIAELTASSARET